MALLDQITGRDIYLDANLFIYYIEGIEPYAELLDPLFAAMDRNQVRGVTSEHAVAECLVAPLRTKDTLLADAFRRALRPRQSFILHPISYATWEHAALLRSRTSLKLPDALHLAVAETTGCATFVTNDAAFRETTHLTVVVLKDLVAA